MRAEGFEHVEQVPLRLRYPQQVAAELPQPRTWRASTPLVLLVLGEDLLVGGALLLGFN
ncbi:hypothetical protein [Couchioplanes caeruleus]|uniref:hypothetical protein n=1 Tax=Couchioplanes caeruleus TaxID=56438 RepID=UPI001474C4E8|nr:hypothetical protein [Couchioplanes caeruleus]